MADLTDDDVLQILELVERSRFDYFHLEMGDLKVTVSREADPAMLWAGSPATTAGTSGPADGQPSTLGQSQPSARDLGSADGLLPVRASTVGTFYTQPEGGAPPYVRQGSKVDEDTTVGLIKIVNTFKSVQAGIRGVVASILAENGQFVEYDQTLLLVRPDEHVESPMAME